MQRRTSKPFSNSSPKTAFALNAFFATLWKKTRTTGVSLPCQGDRVHKLFNKNSNTYVGNHKVYSILDRISVDIITLTVSSNRLTTWISVRNGSVLLPPSAKNDSASSPFQCSKAKHPLRGEVTFCPFPKHVHPGLNVGASEVGATCQVFRFMF